MASLPLSDGCSSLKLGLDGAKLEIPNDVNPELLGAYLLKVFADRNNTNDGT